MNGSWGKKTDTGAACGDCAWHWAAGNACRRLARQHARQHPGHQVTVDYRGTILYQTREARLGA